MATVIAVFLASRLAYRRTSAEKLWDLRRQSYSSIISELTFIEQACAMADEMIEEDEDRFFHGEDDYIIFSPEFASIMDKLRAAGNDVDHAPPVAHEKFALAVRQYRALLLAQARSEIAPTKRRWWLLWLA